ncbi:EAL domain-containing protein [Raoultella ornithinolytica]|uniref:EAL domain-containing protein n=1 Tax=Raoultella ornithinolytica TaxID=54291 RepID=UPI001BAC16A8|nr:EAL domain-containing protein [Raoultella ornithinolytica]
MNRRTLHNVLRILGVTLVVLLPVVLALWFAQIRAKAETSDRLHAFSQLALQKTEMVVYEADRAREKALQFKGTICSFAHQQYMLSVVRSLLYVDDLIYADGTRLFCSTAVRPDTAWRIPPANYTKKPDIAIYYYRDTPFYPGFAMNYMQRGHYIAVINPLSYSSLISSDKDLSYGLYDTKTNQFFSTSKNADPAVLHGLIRQEDAFFRHGNRVYTVAHSAIRPIAVIMSTSYASYYQSFYDQVTLTLPLGGICSILILLVWWRTRQQYHSPRNMLQRALNRRQLCLHYQPTIDIENNRCVGAEALLRWPGFDGPVMTPAEFIPLAENEGMIAQVTDYVVDELFSELGEFLAGHPHLYIAINLSATDFHSSRLIAQIGEKARSYAVNIDQIKIEVTERGFIDVQKTMPVIQAFREAGYEIAIDDFGTGYSNLYNLHSLNVDILKIDKSFIDTLTTNSTSYTIAEHIIEMARSLHLKTVAEGVETADQVNWLRKRGVRYCQGWHFAKAMPPQEFRQWLANAPGLLSPCM